MKVVEEKHHVFITTGTEELDSIDGSTIDCNDGAPVSGKTAYSDSHPVTNETPYSDSHPVSGESTSYSDRAV